jgi:hypothetical protein
MRMEDEVVRLNTTFVLELTRPSWKRMAHSISANPLPENRRQTFHNRK